MSLAQVGGTRSFNSAQDQNKATVIGTPCLLFNIIAFNGGNAASFIQFFDALAVNVTVGSTAPTFVVGLPTGGGANIFLNLPEKFSIGIVVACTATATGNGAPNVAATLELGYVGG